MDACRIWSARRQSRLRSTRRADSSGPRPWYSSSSGMATSCGVIGLGVGDWAWLVTTNGEPSVPPLRLVTWRAAPRRNPAAAAP